MKSAAVSLKYSVWKSCTIHTDQSVNLSDILSLSQLMARGGSTDIFDLLAVKVVILFI